MQEITAVPPTNKAFSQCNVVEKKKRGTDVTGVLDRFLSPVKFHGYSVPSSHITLLGFFFPTSAKAVQSEHRATGCMGMIRHIHTKKRSVKAQRGL